MGAVWVPGILTLIFFLLWLPDLRAKAAPALARVPRVVIPPQVLERLVAVAIVAAMAGVAFFFLKDPIMEHKAESSTRVICGDPCTNPDWVIATCMRDAREAGNMDSLLKMEFRLALQYFRGCLVEGGLEWEECEVGDQDCVEL